MSRIGKKRFALPQGVTVNIAAGAVEVRGRRDSLKQRCPPAPFRQGRRGPVAKLEREEDPSLLEVPRSARSLVANAVAGVTDG